MPDCPRGGGLGCDSCQRMCNSVPCWGTPEELQAIMEAGYSDRLSLTTRINWPLDCDDPQDVELLMPSPVGYEGVEVEEHTGRCTFLTSDGLCELHTLGLKPVEGRTALCKSFGDAEDNQTRRSDLITTWDGQSGQSVVVKWSATRQRRS